MNEQNDQALRRAFTGLCSIPVTDAGRTAAAIADEAIGLFLELRDQHGHDEELARVAAVNEIAEGYSVSDEDLRP